MTAPSDTVRTRVRVGGRVQGVFFRESCLREARAARVCGWIRNCNDGTVEAVFEGAPAAVARMVAWCRTGPARAEVAWLENYSEEPIGETSFRVAGA